MSTNNHIDEEKNTIEGSNNHILFDVKDINKNNFTFKCEIEKNYCTYFALCNFTNMISSELFYILKTQNNEIKDMPIGFVCKIIKEFIKDNEYTVYEPFNKITGIKIKFLSKYLDDEYILNIPYDNFKKEYTKLKDKSADDLRVLVNYFSNELERIEKKLDNMNINMEEQISRITLIRNTKFENCAFSINYSDEDIFYNNGTLKKWAVDLFNDKKESDELDLLKHQCLQFRNVDHEKGGIITNMHSNSASQAYQYEIHYGNFFRTFNDNICKYLKIINDKNKYYLNGSMHVISNMLQPLKNKNILIGVLKYVNIHLHSPKFWLCFHKQYIKIKNKKDERFYVAN